MQLRHTSVHSIGRSMLEKVRVLLYMPQSHSPRGNPSGVRPFNRSTGSINFAGGKTVAHSHSIVPGGFEVMS